MEKFVLTGNKPTNNFLDHELPTRATIMHAWMDWRTRHTEYAPLWKHARFWSELGDGAVLYDAALAYLLALARVNPALPPRARSAGHAVSKMAACAVFLRTLREVQGAPRLWARILIDKGNAVYSVALQEASEITRAIAARVIGSRRRYPRDRGGHWHAVVDQLARGWLTGEREVAVQFAPVALQAFPLTVGAIAVLTVEKEIARIDHAFSHAMAACEEWVIPPLPDATSGNGNDGENAPTERVFAEKDSDFASPVPAEPQTGSAGK